MTFCHPSLWIVSGASQSGKSEWCCRFIEHADTLFDNKFDSFVWCYYGNEEAVPRARLGKKVVFHRGLPDDFSEFPANSLIIIDDLQSQAVSDRAVLNLFTRGSHHDRQTVCLVLQNLFSGGKNYRTLSLNTHVYVLFRSIRDKAQAAIFFRQISPTHWRELTRIYESTTQKPFSYFVVDCHPRTINSCLRFRTDIFPDDPAQTVYCLPSEFEHHGSLQSTGPTKEALVPPARP
jgi:hypothetical protein